ncbi:MAG: hypothetical protein AABX16_05285 [Nanoarchaeota archaeon]
MAAQKQTKVITKRRKFISVDVPALSTKIELIGNNIKEIENKTIKLDLTRYLKGKSVEGDFRITIQDDKAIAIPFQIKLMSYFIRRMIRKRISYVEDSFAVPSQESMLTIKPFLITRKRVSRAVRKTLRNKARNWLEDYLSDKTNEAIFVDILSNRLQRSLSLMLKKTYPLSLCEIRMVSIIRKLKPEEVPLIKVREKPIEQISLTQIEAQEQEEKIKEAEAEIKKTQKKASKKQKEIVQENTAEKETLENQVSQEPTRKIAKKKKDKEEK